MPEPEPDSSDSEDEHLKNLLLAADTNLLNDSLYKTETDESEKKKTAKTLPPKSQRYLDMEETNPSDIVVSEATQEFIAKKLSEVIAKQIEFVDFVELESPVKIKKRKSKLKLLPGCDEYVKLDEEIPHSGPRVKPTIKKRTIEKDPSDEIDDDEKLKSVVVDGEFVASREEVKSWSNRSKGEVVQFKAGKDGTLHFMEPTNEFTKIRKKNTWSEKRIATTRM